MNSWWKILCCLLFGYGFWALAQNSADPTTLANLKADIQRSEQSLKEIDSLEKGSLQVLLQLSEHIQKQEELLQNLSHKKQELTNEILKSKARDSILRDQIQKQKSVMLHRIQWIYKQSFNPLKLRQNANPLINYLDWRKILLQDLSEIRKYNELLHQKNINLTQSQKIIHEIELKSQESQSLQHQLNLYYEKEDTQIVLLKQSKDSIRQSIAQKLAKQQQLNQIIQTMSTNTISEQDMDQNKVQCAPVHGPIKSPYGKVRDPELGTETFNTGVEITIKQNTAIRSVHTGKVMSAKNQSGWGKTIIIQDHLGYFTVYAHLDEIKVQIGDEVKACDEIAHMTHTPTFLSFHIYQNRRHINPTPWLSLP